MATYLFQLAILDDQSNYTQAEHRISTPWGDPSDDDRDAVLRSAIPLFLGTYEKAMAKMREKRAEKQAAVSPITEILSNTPKEG
jgi:hypothetical protein